MAAPEEILTILESLLHAFPGQKITRDTFQVYIHHLSDIHPQLLQMSADSLIATATWFPRISEIRAEASRISGTSQLSTWSPPHNYLIARYHHLEQQFFHHAILDSDAWIALADEFDRQDRPYSAEGTRRRLATFQQALNSEH
jgi:hypothetical protein